MRYFNINNKNINFVIFYVFDRFFCFFIVFVLLEFEFMNLCIKEKSSLSLSYIFIFKCIGV